MLAAKQTWSQPEIKGTPPTPRDSHSCTTVGNNLYVFGGTDGMRPLRDLHILDTCEQLWPPFPFGLTLFTFGFKYLSVPDYC